MRVRSVKDCESANGWKGQNRLGSESGSERHDRDGGEAQSMKRHQCGEAKSWRRQHTQQEVDEESPGWRQLLPLDADLLREGNRLGRAASGKLRAAEAAGAGGEAAGGEGAA